MKRGSNSDYGVLYVIAFALACISLNTGVMTYFLFKTALAIGGG